MSFLSKSNLSMRRVSKIISSNPLGNGKFKTNLNPSFSYNFSPKSLLSSSSSRIATNNLFQVKRSSLFSTRIFNFSVSSILRSFSLQKQQPIKPPSISFDEGVKWVASKPVQYKEVPLFNLSNEQVGTIKLKRDIFEVPIRTDIIHRVVVWQLAKRRKGVAKAKNRAEVRGGGRKPRPQKKTGRARVGSIRSPLFRGGGVTFPPRPRSYYFPLQKKVRKFGLKCALSARLAQGKLIIVDNFELPTLKTRNLNEIIERNNWQSSLIFDASPNTNLIKAGSSLPTVDVFTKGLNVYSILLRDKLILTRSAVEFLEKQLTIENPYKLVGDEEQLN